MLAFTYGSNAFDVLLFLHILCAVIGFGSTFAWPLLAAKGKVLPPRESLAVSRAVNEVAHIITTPFTITTGLLGFGIAGMTKDAADNLIYEFSDTWVMLAAITYCAGVGVALGLHTPNLKAMLGLQEQIVARLDAGEVLQGPPPEVAELQARGKKAGMFGGILHLLFFVMMVLMIFKPGA